MTRVTSNHAICMQHIYVSATFYPKGGKVVNIGSGLVSKEDLSRMS